MLLNESRRDGLGLSSSTRSKFRLPRARLNRRDVRSPDQGSPPATTAATVPTMHDPARKLVSLFVFHYLDCFSRLSTYYYKFTMQISE